MVPLSLLKNSFNNTETATFPLQAMLLSGFLKLISDCFRSSNVHCIINILDTCPKNGILISINVSKYYHLLLSKTKHTVIIAFLFTSVIITKYIILKQIYTYYKTMYKLSPYKFLSPIHFYVHFEQTQL